MWSRVVAYSVILHAFRKVGQGKGFVLMTPDEQRWWQLSRMEWRRQGFGTLYRDQETIASISWNMWRAFLFCFFWGIRNRRAQVHLLPNDYAGWGLLSTLMCVDQILRNYWLLWTSMNGLTEYWICMACFNWIWSTETIDRWSYVVKCWTWFLPYWNGNLRRLQLIAVHWTWTPYMAESFSLSNRRDDGEQQPKQHLSTERLPGPGLLMMIGWMSVLLMTGRQTKDLLSTIHNYIQIIIFVK